jgi:translocation and assembly module TamB
MSKWAARRWAMFRWIVHSEASTLLYAAQSTLVGAKVDASGQTRLTGDYETQAKINFSGLDIGTVTAMFSSANVKAQSSIERSRLP